MSEPPSLVDRLKQAIADDGSEIGRRTAVVTGSVALGALVTGSLFRKIRHLKLQRPADLEPALGAETKTLEIMEGRTRFYERDGTGVPLVLLHGINATASSFEMKPIFDHVASGTQRPIYALDWFGFGRSDRPPVRYTPSIYIRQLRRFLSEHVHQPADIVALSLSCEYAADIARSLPYLVNRLVLMSPTALSDERSASPPWQRTAVSVANSLGAFEIFYFRLTREEVLRRFYQRQVFRRPDVPEELIEYATKTTHVLGAHHAPRYFVQGLLSTGGAAPRAYAALRVPTLMVVPESSDGLIQRFDRLGEVVNQNPEYLRAERLPGGLLPQWEVPYHLFDLVDNFLNT